MNDFLADGPSKVEATRSVFFSKEKGEVCYSVRQKSSIGSNIRRLLPVSSDSSEKSQGKQTLKFVY